METKPGQPSPKGDRKTTRRVALVTAAQLDALERSGANEMTRRLAATIRQAWRERDEAIGSLEIERAEWAAANRKPDTTGAAEAFEGREKVLVIVEPDGFVSVFAENWIDCKLLEVKPWDNLEEAKMPDCYRSLFLPGKLRASGQTWQRIELTPDALSRILLWEARIEQNAAIERVIDLLRKA